MRSIIRAILALVLLASCSAGTPPPSEQDGRALLQRKLELIFIPPFSIEGFAKSGGKDKKQADAELYEMDFTAVVKYPTDDIRCIYPFCPQLSSGDLLAVFDKPNKTISIKGRLTFEKTKEGWVGQM